MLLKRLPIFSLVFLASIILCSCQETSETPQTTQPEGAQPNNDPTQTPVTAPVTVEQTDESGQAVTEVPSVETTSSAPMMANPGNRWNEQGVSIEITKPPNSTDCTKAEKRDTVHYTYSMRTKDGKLLETNKYQEPFIFRLGVGAVIKGLDVAMDGMCVGEERRAVIPPNMGFKKGAAHVPADTTLIFDLRLDEIEPYHHKWTEQGIHIEVIEDVPESECRHARKGDSIHMMFTLTTNKDELIDFGNAKLLKLNLAKQQVVPGLDIGMMGICEGERRKITIPSYWGYGTNEAPR